MTRAAVILTGAIAVALVARAASIYRGADSLAFALVLLIGFGLCLGIAELMIRAGQAARLGREIAGLPAEATIEAVDAASPALRGLLRARIAGVSGAMTTAPFTPYLLGLLVMIGMLGTFLGLFRNAARGARGAHLERGRRRAADRPRGADGRPLARVRLLGRGRVRVGDARARRGVRAARRGGDGERPRALRRGPARCA